LRVDAKRRADSTPRNPSECTVPAGVQPRTIRSRIVEGRSQGKGTQSRLGNEEGTLLGRPFGFLIWKSPGEAAGPKMGSGSRFGNAGARG